MKRLKFICGFVPLLVFIPLSLSVKLEKDGSKPSFTRAGAGEVCGDETWYRYIDQKCIKLIDEPLTFEAGVARCQEEIGGKDVRPLISVQSADEQAALSNLIFSELQVVNDVWLGARRSKGDELGLIKQQKVNKTRKVEPASDVEQEDENTSPKPVSGPQFVWSDGTPLSYKNWAAGHPIDDERLECAQLTSRLSRYSAYHAINKFNMKSSDALDGLWKSTSCFKKNLVICEKSQRWGLNQLQESFANLRQQLILKTDELTEITTVLEENYNTLYENQVELEERYERMVGEFETNHVRLEEKYANMVGHLQKSHLQLEDKHERLVSNLESLQNNFDANPVPVGFLYTEFPRQAGPKDIWPQCNWTDVTEDYAGLFFRAEGGESAAFGFTQIDSARQIDQMEFEAADDCNFRRLQTIPQSGWSAYGKSSSNYWDVGKSCEGIRFHTTDTEIRPRNTAIRIWKRTE